MTTRDRARRRAPRRYRRRGWAAGPSAPAGPQPSLSNGLSTVRNAARLLKVFRSRGERPRRLRTGPAAVGLGKSTVHRLLTTLAAEGLIEQDARTGNYRLGLVMFELGEAVRVHMDLHAAAGPVLAELRAQTQESSQVGVLDGAEVVYIDRLESAHSLRLFTETGRRVPVHCTSSGKVLLAYLPEPELRGAAAGGSAHGDDAAHDHQRRPAAGRAPAGAPGAAGPRPSTSVSSDWPRSPRRSVTPLAPWWPLSASEFRWPGAP